jgi:Cu-Zn family superoxide dismutase
MSPAKRRINMNEKPNIWLVSLICALLLTLAGCQKEESQPPAAPEKETPMETQQPQVEAQQPARAVAELKPTQNNRVTGMVTFESMNGKIRIVADLEGLDPGMHGFHIHQFGDCSAPDASSAGEHFNPENTAHGAPDNPAAQRHVGDLGNVEADSSGKAHYEREDQIITLQGLNAIVGKAVIVHAQPDDLTSQPIGNAGPRVACGVNRAEN